MIIHCVSLPIEATPDNRFKRFPRRDVLLHPPLQALIFQHSAYLHIISIQFEPDVWFIDKPGGVRTARESAPKTCLQLSSLYILFPSFNGFLQNVYMFKEVWLRVTWEKIPQKKRIEGFPMLSTVWCISAWGAILSSGIFFSKIFRVDGGKLGQEESFT